MNALEFWMANLKERSEPWVLFSGGTCVFVSSPQESALESALSVLASSGPLSPGTPLADFSVYRAKGGGGFVVTYADERLVSYVSRLEDEVDLDNKDVQLRAGLRARQLRARDAEEKQVVFVGGAS